MRPEELAEMEYREAYRAIDMPQIETWAKANYPSSYAGAFVDHRAGGIIRVGFTGNQSTALADLKTHLDLPAEDRLAGFVIQPDLSISTLEVTAHLVETAWDANPTLRAEINSVDIDEIESYVEVTGPNPALISSLLSAYLPANAPIQVVYEANLVPYQSRYHTDGRILAGDRVKVVDVEAGVSFGCTAGFGAYDRTGTKPNGQPEIAAFLLMSGHCAEAGQLIYRPPSESAKEETWRRVGHAARTGFYPSSPDWTTDGSAVKLNTTGLMPRYTNAEEDWKPKPNGPAGRPEKGERLCAGLGKSNRRACGDVIRVRPGRFDGKQAKMLFVVVNFDSQPGDSGSPVWSPSKGISIGMLSSGVPGKSLITPLLTPFEQDAAEIPGILNAPGMNSVALAVPGED